jgi:hypothetical protein
MQHTHTHTHTHTHIEDVITCPASTAVLKDSAAKLKMFFAAWLAASVCSFGIMEWNGDEKGIRVGIRIRLGIRVGMGLGMGM